MLAAFQEEVFPAPTRSVDKASGGALKAIIASGDFEPKLGRTRMLYGVAGVTSGRVLLVGLGSRKKFGPGEWRRAVRSACDALKESGASSAGFCFDDIPVAGMDTLRKSRQLVIAAAEACYRFGQMKSTPPTKYRLLRIDYILPTAKSRAEAETGVSQGRAIGSGMQLARDLGNLPGNVCTPSYLAEEAARLGREWKLQVRILEQKDMEKLGMGALLSVAKGSRQPPKLIVVRYMGTRDSERPIVLVGKGITFDTGGISLKPGPEMDEMKFDMCGAAGVLGTLRAIAQLKPRLNVIGIIPAAENMPDGMASKPGDIVTSMSGQTVEILNTDAEGRLILCDALTYCSQFKPAAVVDIATLTGACVIALGHVCSGLFANNQDLALEIIQAGESTWDRVWQMPLWDDYQDQLRSNFADFANIGGRAAGSVTAACFLSRFARDLQWAHLDIAGTAWTSGKDKGASGRPVPLLTEFILNRARKSGAR